MTKSSPQVFVNLDWHHSADEAKEFFNKTGILIITRGELFSGYANLLFEIYGSDIIIPEGIDSIGEHAFDGLPITSITLPNSVKYIGEFAFRNTNLTEVDLSSVTGIGEYAFTETPITSIKLSPNLYDLGPGAFSDTELQSVVVSSTHAPRTNQYYPPEYYVHEAFDKDTVLILDGIITRDLAEQLIGRSGSNLIVPEGVVGIDANAFAGMSVEKIILPDSLKTIGHSAFAGSQISEVAIPNSVVDIGEGAFAGTPLVSVDIGEGVRSIGDYAFAGTQITNIELPGSLESIGEGAFAGTSLENVEVPENVIEVGFNAFPEPVLPDPIFEFSDPMMIMNSETIQFESARETFDPLTNPNPISEGTVSEFIEPDSFGISGSVSLGLMTAEPITDITELPLRQAITYEESWIIKADDLLLLEGLLTDGSAEFSEEQLQADLVNPIAASTEVLA